ncbi:MULTISPECIES: SRPBCC family protein [unclassified Leptospira]|uniref:LIC13081 family protein n=1 Tax=unclassified Leptospira TaxID=2633828 RepID=UPI00055F0086|nr:MULTISPECIES: SRPBCC family protein [unclassified Leptospira]MCR1794640.1 SRPBCC family protein [Leptospira sp. id769339]
MATTTIAFTVPISLSRAFDYVSNFERFPDWSGNILSFKKNESTSGFQVKVRFWFFPCKFEYRIIESKYPSRLVFRIKSRFSDQTETFSFYPDPKGSDTDTKILFTSQMELSGLYKIFGSWIFCKIFKNTRRDIRKLQEILSQGKILGIRNFQVIHD